MEKVCILLWTDAQRRKKLEKRGEITVWKEALKYSRVRNGYHGETMIGVHQKSSRADEGIGVKKSGE